MDYGKEYTEDQNKKSIGIMGILCGHWNCGGSFGLGIAEDHGIRNRNDMGVDTGKNPYSILYSARVSDCLTIKKNAIIKLSNTVS